MLMLAPLAAVAIAQESEVRVDGVAVNWKSAQTLAAAAAEADSAQVLGLIDGSGVDVDGPWACASCHGKTGEGTQTIPRLAGLPAGYVAKQLHDYKRGARLDANMQYVASRLDEAEMAALGAFYSALETPPSARPSFGGDLERGRELALAGDWSVNLPSCFACHGPLGWGVEQIFPPIAGQHPAYTHAQLAAWKEGRRTNSPLGLMHRVAAALSEADMRAVSDYLATLPPPQRPVGSN